MKRFILLIAMFCIILHLETNEIQNHNPGYTVKNIFRQEAAEQKIKVVMGALSELKNYITCFEHSKTAKLIIKNIIAVKMEINNLTLKQ